MRGWTTAWDNPAEEEASAGWKPLGTKAVAVVGIALAGWLFLFVSGILPILGWAEGSERHNRHAVYLAEESEFGLPLIFAFEGQTLWWDYDVAVEGQGGVRLWIVKSVPSPDFHVRVEEVTRSGRGRFEVVAPATGFYGFRQELMPHGALLTGTDPGRTAYRLTWGVD